MKRAHALDGAFLQQGEDLMMGYAGDHVIDRTGYIAKCFVTPDAEDLLLL